MNYEQQENYYTRLNAVNSLQKEICKFTANLFYFYYEGKLQELFKHSYKIERLLVYNPAGYMLYSNTDKIPNLYSGRVGELVKNLADFIWKDQKLSETDFDIIDVFSTSKEKIVTFAEELGIIEKNSLNFIDYNISEFVRGRQYDYIRLEQKNEDVWLDFKGRIHFSKIPKLIEQLRHAYDTAVVFEQEYIPIQSRKEIQALLDKINNLPENAKKELISKL